MDSVMTETGPLLTVRNLNITFPSPKGDVQAVQELGDLHR